MQRGWGEATQKELLDRVLWLEAELTLALVLLASQDKSPSAQAFIETAQAIRKASPDDPTWLDRYKPNPRH